MASNKQHKFDSHVIVYLGPRGGGKTLSMVVQSIIEMLKGRPVFSNFPIEFRFVYEDGTYEDFASRPFDEDAFIAQDEGMFGGVIAWDEMALDLNNRDFASVANKTAGKVITLLRKQQQSLLITAQFLYMVDKNVRVQCDAEISCSDLSFKYQDTLERGEMIAQDAKDISGRFTGTTYEDNGEVFSRVLVGKPFWGSYDSLRNFDVLKSQQKIKLNVGYREITRSDLLLGESMEVVLNALKNMPIREMYPAEIAAELTEQGIRIPIDKLKSYLKAFNYQPPKASAIKTGL
jgi:hypothetical protein